MTAATLSRLPLVAGGTLLGSLGRGGFWTATRLLDVGFWGVGQFMRAPIAISAVIAVVGFSAIAGANALYFQHERHPAPLFFSPPRAVVAAPPRVTPVLPAPRPKLQPAALDSEVTGSIAQQPAARPITTDDIKALQNKLIALKLLDSAADGIYGPHTAVAVRAFESHTGMRPDGKLTPALLAALRSYTPPAPDALPAPIATAAAVVGGPVKPVPLAPLPTASAMAIQPATPAAAPAPAQPTAAAASPAAPAPLAVAAAPAAANAAAAPVAANAAAAVPPPAAGNTFAANSLPDGGVAAPSPAAAAPASPLASREDLSSPGAQGQVDPASAASAGLTAAQRLAAQFGTLPPAATAAEAIPDTPANDSQGSTDPALITQIQKGLASLGFLADKIDGVPGEGTAKAIRNFQVFYNYKVTGLATHQLLSLLIQHGGTI